MNIMDLAKAICSECKTDIIGIRPGEKLHEVLIPLDDARNTVELEDSYIVKPAFRYFERRFCEDDCKPVPEDFEYNSGTNDRWLDIEELREMIKPL